MADCFRGGRGAFLGRDPFPIRAYLVHVEHGAVSGFYFAIPRRTFGVPGDVAVFVFDAAASEACKTIAGRAMTCASERDTAGTTPEEPTTPDLVELVRRGIDAFARRDYDAVVALLAPSAVWDMAPMGGLVGASEGRDAIRGVLEDWSRPYEDSEHELEEVRDIGNGVGFVVVHERARLVGTSWAVALRSAHEARAAAERLAVERG